MAEEAEVANKQVVFDVQMVCGGCSGAVTRILNKMEGVIGVDANLETQKVTVAVAEGGPSPDEMLVALKKWGENANKTVELAAEVEE
mmetsp:Transcript_61250/g.115303  ORF Transcript_61250/g.115303 Transcript_61250/m.115303 type:complete len:87 (-) Transcript_61250:411-671(-)|eukprot:CAMPEP_0171606510 /NCGR_PEP_ID=MMETSP0990-20121206/7807_1 /TAXON_ID=483369 /ORGANISM="non described non described, Strain CCMP2098" /LENGTH=86 /DNA_ID=CAMNT_0012169363 /DNA_START=14 /DNA_END=274 /DNA_ORIENTATION=-